MRDAGAGIVDRLRIELRGIVAGDSGHGAEREEEMRNFHGFIG